MIVKQPKTLVISFQRSGINWLRHCAEHFSGVRTPGRAHMVKEGPFLFDRTHDVAHKSKRSEFKSLYQADGNEVYGRVALLIRNPFETFVSQYTRKGIPFDEGIESFAPYAANIGAFHDLRRADKAVFYYEDFASQEAGTFAFLRFIGVEPSPCDFPALIEASRAWYSTEWGLLDRRPELSDDERTAIRKLCRRRLGQLTKIYLGRYFTRQA